MRLSDRVCTSAEEDKVHRGFKSVCHYGHYFASTDHSHLFYYPEAADGKNSGIYSYHDGNKSALFGLSVHGIFSKYFKGTG